MSDTPVVHIGENSPEHVAYRLLRDLMTAEDRGIRDTSKNRVDRKWLLDTYAECLYAANGHRDFDE